MSSILQTPVAQKVQPEAQGIPQIPQQPPVVSQSPPEPTVPSKPKNWLIEILIILLVLIGLGGGGFLVWENFFTSRTSVPTASIPGTRKTTEEGPIEAIYKGVWMPALGASVIPKNYFPEGLIPEGYDISIMEPVFADFDKAEEAGINTFATQMSYWANERGELTMPPEVKEFMASFIDRAHARGFKIWLNPEILHYVEKGSASDLRIMPEELIENTDLIKNFEAAIIETAKFAEEHDVEIFSPASESYVNLDFDIPGRERSKKLLIDIKPKIDAVYSGKICLRSEWPIPEFLPHYSCFGPSIGAPRSEQEKNELINHIEQEINKGVELIIGEIYEGSDWQGTQEEAKRNFEMALEAAKGRVSGVFILDIGHTYRQLFPESFESVIKELYQEF